MYSKQTLMNIVLTAIAMLITIVGLCIKTGYFHTGNPDLGYPMIAIGGFFTVFFFMRMINS